MTTHHIEQADDAPDDSTHSNVLAFVPRPRKVPVEPLFSDAERVQLRQMLEDFQVIKRRCPMAKELTGDT